MNDYEFLLKRDLPSCSKACLKGDVSCPIKDCRQWIDYEEDLNCTSIAIEKNGSMTLREVADRIHVSFVRIKQIEDKVAAKFQKGLAKEFGIKKQELRDFIMSAFDGVDDWTAGKSKKKRPGQR